MQTQASPVLVPNAVLLLTGYYDFACTAENTLRTLAQILGADGGVMKESATSGE